MIPWRMAYWKTAFILWSSSLTKALVPAVPLRVLAQPSQFSAVMFRIEVDPKNRRVSD